MATRTSKQNEEIINSIEPMETSYIERFQEFVSELKLRIRSTSKTKAEKIFLSALPILSFKFPDPAQDTNAEEEEVDVVQELARLRLEVSDLKSQHDQLLQEGLKKEVSKLLKAEHDQWTTEDLNIVKQETLKRVQKLERKTASDLETVRSRVKTFEAKVSERLDELSETTKINGHSVRGLRQLQAVLKQRNQKLQVSKGESSTSATAATASTGAASPRDVRQRMSFLASVAGEQHRPDIENVVLLPGGLLVLADWEGCSIKVFNIQGRHLHRHPCKSKPYRLASIESNTSATSFTLVACLPDKNIVDILGLDVKPLRIRVKNSLRTLRKYTSVTALDRQTLAAGYYSRESKGIDLMDLAGILLRQLDLDIEPWCITATVDGDLVCSTTSDTILKLRLTTGQTIYDVKVPQIKDISSITTAPDGSLLVTDRDTNSLHLVTSKGKWLKQLWTVHGGRSRDDALRSLALDNRVCVCITEHGLIYVLDVEY